MFAQWKHMDIVITKGASKELLRDHLTLHDIIEVLEKGVDCKPRKTGIIERKLETSEGTIRVVVAEDVQEWSNEKVWVLIHVKLHTGR